MRKRAPPPGVSVQLVHLPKGLPPGLLVDPEESENLAVLRRSGMGRGGRVLSSVPVLVAVGCRCATIAGKVVSGRGRPVSVSSRRVVGSTPRSAATNMTDVRPLGEVRMEKFGGSPGEL